jgi:hypothetical protein
MKQKSNVFLRSAFALLMVATATLGILSNGTLAKYTVAAQGNSVARVARYSVFVSTTNNPAVYHATPATNGTTPILVTTLAGNASSLFNLDAITANTTYESRDLSGDNNLLDMATNQHYTLSTNSENITAGPAANPGLGESVDPDIGTGSATNNAAYRDGTLIAPGTGGRLYISIFNNSEVAIKVTLTANGDTISTLTADQINYNSGTNGTANIGAGLLFGNAINAVTATTITNVATVAAQPGCTNPVNGMSNVVIIQPGATFTYGSAANGIFWMWRFNYDSLAANGVATANAIAQDIRDTALGIAAANTTNALITDAVGASGAAIKIHHPQNSPTNNTSGGTGTAALTNVYATAPIIPTVYGRGANTILGVSYRLLIEQVD